MTIRHRLLGVGSAVGLGVAVSLTSLRAQEGATTYKYREVDGQTLNAFVFFPKTGEYRGPRAAVLLFHGGGWHAGSPEWTFATARRFAGDLL